ncbi:MAG: Radical domain protein [Firmicutes bacterium]|nr:Radical domain protein [Bacillota bacterium]
MDHNKNFTIITKEKRQILRELLPLKKPLALFIEPTNMCNFQCKPCAHGQEKNREDLKPFMHLDYDLYRRMINELKEWQGAKLKLLRLTALGEPFMNPKMCDMIRLAKKADIAERVDLFSNGSLLTKEICEDIVDSGLDHIRISIYAVLPDHHKDVTRNNISIQKIRENIAMLRQIRDQAKKTKPYIQIKMFDTYSYENDVFTAMYKDIADEFGFEKVHDATKYNDSDLVGSYYTNPDDANRTREEFANSLNDFKTCPRPFMAMVICANGDVVMCTHDAPRATKIASVKEQGLKEIWDGESLYKFRKMLLTGNKHENRLCKNCEWFRLFPPEDNVDGFPLNKLPGGGSDD